jgi:hypothetical protein
MAIGKHEVKIASNTDLKRAIEAGLDEVLTALEESFYDLSDEQAWRFPLPGRNNIAWIVMHCLDNLDDCAVGAQTGKRLLPEEPRWDLWQCAPEERPKPGDPFPAVSEMLGWLRQVRAAAMAALDAADEAALVAKTLSHPQKPTRSDFTLRTICHTNAHVRQIWLLRGVMGLHGETAWPRQHWA